MQFAVARETVSDVGQRAESSDQRKGVANHSPVSKGTASGDNGADTTEETKKSSSSSEARESYSQSVIFEKKKQYDKSFLAAVRATKCDANFADAWVQKGKIELHRGQFIEALHDFDTALRLNPKHINALNLGGYALLQLKRTREAHHRISSALAIDSRNAEAWHFLADLYVIECNYPESEKCFERSLKLKPDVDTYIDQAGLFQQRHMWTEALASVNHAIALDPSDANAYTCRATIYYCAERLEPAVADATKALQIHPNDTAALNARCAAYCDMKKFPEGLRDANKAWSLTKEPTYLSNRGVIYLKMGKTKEFFEDQDTCLKLFPHYAPAHLQKGNAYDNQGKTDLAIIEYRATLKDDPTNGEAWALLAGQYHKKKAFRASEDAYDHAMKLFKSARLYTDEGCLYEDEYQIQRAKDDFTNALKLDPKYWKAIVELAYINYLTGNCLECISLSNRALQINPKSFGAYNNRALGYLSMSKFPQALADINRAIALNSGALYYCNRAFIYLEMHKIKECLSDIDTALKLEPTRATAYGIRGLVFGGMGKWHEAIEQFTKAINYDPNLNTAFEDRGRAYAAIGDYKSAMADWDRTLQRSPTFQTLFDRGRLAAKLGYYEQAILDLDEASKIRLKEHSEDAQEIIQIARCKQLIDSTSKFIKLNSKDPALYYERALLQMLANNYAAAIDDLHTTQRLSNWQGRTSICASLLCVVCKNYLHDKAGATREINEATPQCKSSEWPRPILLYYQDKLTPENLCSQAKDKVQLQQARTYIALRLASENKITDALQQATWCKQHCDPRADEYSLLMTSLNRLKLSKSGRKHS